MKKPSALQTSPFIPVAVQPIGDPWAPSADNIATVPMPLPIIIVNIDGPYTERDRKLYAFLLHAVWNELETKTIHELPVSNINKVFRELGGDNNFDWIWESAKRLAKTTIEWEQTEGDKRYQGISSLLSAAVTDYEARLTGKLKFAFSPLLIPIIKAPGRFARLRVHFLIGLSGKYAVSLYEILESAVNMKKPVLEVELSTLRQWLKIADGKLGNYADLRRFVLEPAIRQINDNPDGSGFSVAMTAIRSGRAIERIRFNLSKSPARIKLEDTIQRDKPAPQPQSNHPISLKTATYEKAKKAAPGLDVYHLEAEWREWVGKQATPAKNPDGAFVSFCKKRYASAVKC